MIGELLESLCSYAFSLMKVGDFKLIMIYILSACYNLIHENLQHGVLSGYGGGALLSHIGGTQHWVSVFELLLSVVKRWKTKLICIKLRFVL